MNLKRQQALKESEARIEAERVETQNFLETALSSTALPSALPADTVVKPVKFKLNAPLRYSSRLMESLNDLPLPTPIEPLK